MELLEGIHDRTSDTATLDEAFRSSLGLTDDVELQTAAYGRTAEWDSVAHMQLVAGIERAFGIMIETDDVIAMSSYPIVQQILASRYDLVFDA